MIRERARSDVWCQTRRFQLARLETRTKEFIRMCEYVSHYAHMRNESERQNVSSADRLHSSA